MPVFPWDPTKPAGNDPISQGDDLIRQDKDTLRKVLRTLTPWGTNTVGWRLEQIGNVSYLVHNLYYDGSQWYRDDVTKAGAALVMNENGTLTYHMVAAGSNPVGANLPAARVTFQTDGRITVAAGPTGSLDLATKAYVDSAVGGTVSSGGGDIRFLVQGNAMVADRVAQCLVVTGITFTKLYAYADVAPAGAPLSIRIRRNGTQVATLSIPANSNSANATVSIATSAGDRITLDITQVGSSTPGGNDLLVALGP